MIQTSTKNAVLRTLKDLVLGAEERILATNKIDVQAYSGNDHSMQDRLLLTPTKVAGMGFAIDEIIALPDPVGGVLYEKVQPNGLDIQNVAVPFGTILIIYESRPDVTVEAAITAFKAGNIILLKGGKESLQSNLVLVALWHQALKAHGLPESWVQYLQLDREQTRAFIIDPSNKIDLIIPRGGDALIAFVQQHAHAPVLVSGRGNNFLLVDNDCDIDMAVKIILDGKSRVSVCNALDKVVFLSTTPGANEQVNAVVDAAVKNGLELVGDATLSAMNEQIKEADDTALKTEFLSEKLMLVMAENIEAAIYIINENAGGHSAVIVSNYAARAERFMTEVDSAAVYHNASSRFTDGGQMGLGAEMAISTQKLHARGPVSLAHLVTNKWIIRGTGQVRG